jgi:ABC-type glycerol-3-phosphate transport system permease component
MARQDNTLRGWTATAAAYGLLILVAISVIYPMLWLLSASLKSDAALFTRPFALPDASDLRWTNYTNAWVHGHFENYFLNSLFVSVSAVVLTTYLSAAAAYALSRFAFRGARPILFLFLSGLMLPVQQVIVPLFFQMRDLGLLNSLVGLLTAYVALGLPFGIFVLTGFFKTQPASIYESALVDGAGEVRAFWLIMLPMARSGLLTVAIFTFLATWNEYLIAFMFLSGKGSEAVRTLPLGVANITIQSQYRSDWGMAFAGLVLMLLPTLLICLILQKYITKGLTAGAVKG